MRLKPGERGQGIAIDFLFAVLVFLLVLNACMALMGSSAESASDKILLNELNAKTSQTIDMLVRTEGNPNDWEQHGIDEARIIGLAKRDRALDKGKVDKFVEWAANYSDVIGDYNKVKSLLLIGYDYYFRIVDSDGLLLKETGQPDQAARERMVNVNVKRIVNFNGEEVIAELTIYFPQR